MDKNTPSFNLNVVVRETGIKPDTLRAWERRYGLPDPQRTEGGHRLYSTRDIETIRWLISRQNEGMRISHAVELWKGYQLEGRDPLNPAPRVSASTSMELSDDSALAQLRQSWVTACLGFNDLGAEQAMAEALARYPVEMACTEVLQKGLQIIGERWYQSTATVQQEHFASSAAAKRMQALIAAAPAPTRSAHILVGCPPGEEHTFPPLMINLFLRYQGYQVTYLGANVPLENLEKTLDRVNPDLVVYSGMHLVSAAAILEVANLLVGRLLRFGFGGRIFSIHPQLQKIIPGYFLGDDLDKAVGQIKQILAGNLQSNPTFEPSLEYQEAFQAFSENQNSIELHIFNHFAGSEFSVDLLKDTNQHFTDFLNSALRLGNLEFLDQEISWVETLVGNQEISSEMIHSYLEIFGRLLAEEIGEKGVILDEWFKNYSGNKPSI